MYITSVTNHAARQANAMDDLRGPAASVSELDFN